MLSRNLTQVAGIPERVVEELLREFKQLRGLTKARDELPASFLPWDRKTFLQERDELKTELEALATKRAALERTLRGFPGLPPIETWDKKQMDLLLELMQRLESWVCVYEEGHASEDRNIAEIRRRLELTIKGIQEGLEATLQALPLGVEMASQAKSLLDRVIKWIWG